MNPPDILDPCPHDRALLIHPQHDINLHAVIAPTDDSEVCHLAIMNHKLKRCIYGPVRVRRSEAWNHLFSVAEDWTDRIVRVLPPNDRASIPAPSLDHFLDIMVGGAS